MVLKVLHFLAFLTLFTPNVLFTRAHFFGKFRDKSNYPNIETPTYFGDFDYNEDCPKQCRSTGDCCLGYICSHNSGRNSPEDRGICLADRKEKEKIPCINDKECHPYVCVEAKNMYPSVKFCQKPDVLRNSLASGIYNTNIKKKQFNDFCMTSKDCDQESKLCCAYVRRHRLSPTLRCVYKESAKCIDSIDGDIGDDVKGAADSPLAAFGGRNMNSLSRFFPMRLRPYFR